MLKPAQVWKSMHKYEQGYYFMLNAEKCAKHWESMLKAENAEKMRKCAKSWESLLKYGKVCYKLGTLLKAEVNIGKLSESARGKPR